MTALVWVAVGAVGVLVALYLLGYWLMYLPNRVTPLERVEKAMKVAASRHFGARKDNNYTDKERKIIQRAYLDLNKLYTELGGEV